MRVAAVTASILLGILALHAVLTPASGATIDVDWDNWSFKQYSVSLQDTLNFVFSSPARDLSIARSQEEWNACSGFLLCDVSCEVPLDSFEDDTLFFFSSTNCFKTIFNVTAEPIATAAPNAKRTSPTNAPTRVTKTPTIHRNGTDAPTKRPTTAYPTRPTYSPYVPRDGAGDRISIYIQLDRSASIREANPLCLNQSRETCWNLAIDFLDDFMGNLVNGFGGWTNQLGRPQIRAYISYFTCNPKNSDPLDVIATVPAIVTAENEFQKALRNLRSIDSYQQDRMYGTCPSYGTQRILNWMSVGDWPTAYYILTDGRIQSTDVDAFRNTIVRMRDWYQRKRYTPKICAMTVGDVALAKDFKRLLTSNCVMSVNSFSSLSLMAPLAARSIMGDITNDPIDDGNDGDDDGDESDDGKDEDGDDDSTESPSTSTTTASAISKKPFSVQPAVFIGSIAGAASLIALSVYGIILILLRRHRMANTNKTALVASIRRDSITLTEKRPA